MDGLFWGASKLIPVGYGIKKLQVMCTVEDDKISIEELIEKIEEFEDFVQSCDVKAMNKASDELFPADSSRDSYNTMSSSNPVPNDRSRSPFAREHSRNPEQSKPSGSPFQTEPSPSKGSISEGAVESRSFSPKEPSFQRESDEQLPIFNKIQKYHYVAEK